MNHVDHIVNINIKKEKEIIDNAINKFREIMFNFLDKDYELTRENYQEVFKQIDEINLMINSFREILRINQVKSFRANESNKANNLQSRDHTVHRICI